MGVKTRSSQEPLIAEPTADESWRPTTKRRGRCVLHIDIDAFFAQVEQLKDKSLRDVPVAIRQHGDIICVCHRARALGARKHDNVAKCKELVEQHGGKMIHVHTTSDHMVSYQPYIKASYEFHAKMWEVCQKLRADGKNIIYEKASIDEAYVQIEHGARPSERGKGFAEAVREAIFAECGLVVSVGISRNKLLAKIASKMAKPDGVVVIDTDKDFENAFRNLPSSALPHCKDSYVQAKLEANDLYSAWDIRELNAKRLEAVIGLAPKPAMDLCKAAHGVDDSEVIQKVNEKTSISAQMTLTLKPKPMPKDVGDQVGVTGGRPGWFTPLTCGEHDRIGMTMHALCRDLHEKIIVHESFTKRWPSTLTVKCKIHGTGVQYNKNAPFPLKHDDANTSGDTIGKKAKELAILAIGKRTEELIQHVTVLATNFKSTSAEKVKTIEELMALEADPMKKAMRRMNEKRVKDNRAIRAMMKRQRNERWIQGAEPLPPVDMLLALVGGWEGEDDCVLEVDECRRAIENRTQNVALPS